MDYIKIHESIDHIISRQGGFPRGHLFEIYGPNGAGKTTFATLLIASAQRQEIKCAYIEAEYLDKEHAEFLGVDMDALTLIKTKRAEDIFIEAIGMCNDGYGLIVIDSLGGMVTEAQHETEVGDNGQWAQIASFLAKELPKLDEAASLNNVCVVFTNQIRANIQRFGMGPESDSFGGYTFKHTVGARFEIRRVSWIKYSDKVVGFKLKIRAPIKNRFAPPNREAVMDIVVDHDVDVNNINDRKKTKI